MSYQVTQQRCIIGPFYFLVTMTRMVIYIIDNIRFINILRYHIPIGSVGAILIFIVSRLPLPCTLILIRSDLLPDWFSSLAADDAAAASDDIIYTSTVSATVNPTIYHRPWGSKILEVWNIHFIKKSIFIIINYRLTFFCWCYHWKILM